MITGPSLTWSPPPAAGSGSGSDSGPGDNSSSADSGCDTSQIDLSPEDGNGLQSAELIVTESLPSPPTATGSTLASAVQGFSTPFEQSSNRDGK
eukprot:g30453.t1